VRIERPSVRDELSIFLFIHYSVYIYICMVALGRTWSLGRGAPSDQLAQRLSALVGVK
jgi:hypothetical protein